MLSNILYVLLAIVILGIIVTVHEFGHYCVGRLCGIGKGHAAAQQRQREADTKHAIDRLYHFPFPLSFDAPIIQQSCAYDKRCQI